MTTRLTASVAAALCLVGSFVRWGSFPASVSALPGGSLFGELATGLTLEVVLTGWNGHVGPVQNWAAVLLTLAGAGALLLGVNRRVATVVSIAALLQLLLIGAQLVTAAEAHLGPGLVISAAAGALVLWSSLRAPTVAAASASA